VLYRGGQVAGRGFANVSSLGYLVVTRPPPPLRFGRSKAQSVLATCLPLHGPRKAGRRNGFPMNRDWLYTRTLWAIEEHTSNIKSHHEKIDFYTDDYF